MTVDVAVIGGGVSGLSTAHALKRRGYRVVVLERQARPGGNAVSERIGGFLMEHGPSTVASESPVATDMSLLLGLDGQRCELGDSVRRRYLVRNGDLHGVSVHPAAFLFSNYLSFAGRARLIAECVVPARKSGTEDESVADFCARRFGNEFAARVIDPLVGGLYAGRADELSVSAVFPRLVEMERSHGSICRALFHSRRRGARMPGRRLFSWLDGIGALPCALARELGSAVRSGAVVSAIRPLASGFEVQAGAAGSISARAVVVATQPHVARQLLETVDATAAEAVAQIDAPPMAVVFLGYRRGQVEHPLDGLGFLTPQTEGRDITGAQFCSTMFAGRAPEGHVAIAGYFGGARAPDLARLPTSDLIELARQEFADLIGARDAPVVSKVRHWPRGLPQYRSGHTARIAELDSLAGRVPGMFVTGNYFAGPSVANCLQQAANVAVNVHSFLKCTQNEERSQMADRAATG